MTYYNDYSKVTPVTELFPNGVQKIILINCEEIYSRSYNVNNSGSYKLTLSFKCDSTVDLYFDTLEQLTEAIQTTRRNPHAYLIITRVTENNSFVRDYVTVDQGLITLAEENLK